MNHSERSTIIKYLKKKKNERVVFNKSSVQISSNSPNRSDDVNNKFIFNTKQFISLAEGKVLTHTNKLNELGVSTNENIKVFFLIKNNNTRYDSIRE